LTNLRATETLILRETYNSGHKVGFGRVEVEIHRRELVVVELGDDVVRPHVEKTQQRQPEAILSQIKFWQNKKVLAISILAKGSGRTVTKARLNTSFYFLLSRSIYRKAQSSANSNQCIRAALTLFSGSRLKAKLNT